MDLIYGMAFVIIGVPLILLVGSKLLTTTIKKAEFTSDNPNNLTQTITFQNQFIAGLKVGLFIQIGFAATIFCLGFWGQIEITPLLYALCYIPVMLYSYVKLSSSIIHKNIAFALSYLTNISILWILYINLPSTASYRDAFQSDRTEIAYELFMYVGLPLLVGIFALFTHLFLPQKSTLTSQK